MGRFKEYYFNPKVKELKPKDGYNRFKLDGKILRYKEEDMQTVSGSLMPEEMTEYGVFALDENGDSYDVFFWMARGKYIPHSIFRVPRFY